MTALARDTFRPLGPADAIAHDFVVPYYLDDRQLRSRLRGSTIAYMVRRSLHLGPEACPLSWGLLAGIRIMCQCHGTRLNITTGAVISGPAREALKVYPVREVDGTIELRACGALRCAVYRLPYSVNTSRSPSLACGRHATFRVVRCGGVPAFVPGLNESVAAS